MRKVLRTLCLAALALVPGVCFGGGFTMTASSETGLPGTTVQVNVNLDNPNPVRGFSLGLTHDPAILTILSIAEGSAVSATNGGAGADFFFTDDAPIGGTGLVVGCVLSTAAPIEDLAIGINQLVQIDYAINAGANGGSFSAISFNNSLGDPPVQNVASVAGDSEIPTLVAGSVTVLTPSPENVACLITDPCSCDFQVSWVNTATYSSINILEEGVNIGTLAGSATNFAGTLSANGMREISVVGVSGGLASAPATCIADCPVINPPAAPTALNCTIDNETGIASFDWSNGDSYSAINVFLDGAMVDTLGGAATSSTLALAAFGTYQVCIAGVGACTSSAQACCVVTYEEVSLLPDFIRGDVNADGGFNGLTDALYLLNWQFLSGPEPTCMEAADATGDGMINGLVDTLLILNHAFNGAPPPGAPHPNCGPDPDEANSLGCNSNACP